MPKKRKLNSKNPIYQTTTADDVPQILKKVRMNEATIRSSGGEDTGETANVYGIWYEDNE